MKNCNNLCCVHFNESSRLFEYNCIKYDEGNRNCTGDVDCPEYEEIFSNL